MRYPGMSVFGVIAVFAAGSVLASAGDALSLSCTRESHRYRIGEPAEFLVETSEPGTAVELLFCRVDRNALETCRTVTPARVSFALGKPGFAHCWARRLDGKGKDVPVGVAFEPERLEPSLPPPDDYDRFWEDAFRELDSVPADYEKRRIGKGVYKVSCRTVNGRRMHGLLCLPTGKGPYPLRISVGGGEAYWTESSAFSRHSEAMAILLVHLPPYEPVADDGEAYHKKWLKERDLERFIYDNIDKEARDLYFYPCILGGCRLIDFAVQEPSVDRTRVSYSGSSHGGGFGVYYAAFSPHIKAAFCGVPNFGNLSAPADGRPMGIRDAPLRNIWKKLRYFDAAYCAKRIKVPVFMSVGFVDFSVPPDSVYTVYNELRGPKIMFDKVNHGHGGGPPEYRATYRTWLENVLPPSQSRENRKGR